MCRTKANGGHVSIRDSRPPVARLALNPWYEQRSKQ